ncbi:MAG TPA: sugar porter family MFS transporter [Actinocrinis sp.]|uniref:sugar porter family MFS transporter n=1 Tax=Actinocrinis sp. TaxID=1920516 RepID=UPI002D6B58E0|nr:sugar porter family MFS transporter [Actinocrinis sp.]HZU57845.1 sugar porter family MFS transporter [Actinocrinis sp.]
MSQTVENSNVLTILDERAPTGFYWRLTLLATLGGFLFGYDTSNIGSALNFVPYDLRGLAQGYLVSGASLGAAAGAILAGPAADRFGRKTLLVVDAGIYALGAILSAVTVDAGMLLAARTLIGLAIGADSAIATAYIAEYAPKNRRGSLTMLQQWMITVGILSAYIIALIIYSAWPGSAASVGWRLVLGLGAVPALVGLVLRTQMPESPRWLLRHGRYDEVRKAVRALGAGDVGEQEIRRAASVIEQIEGGDREKRRRAWTPGVRRALAVVCVFFVFQQITGINVPLYYGPHLLGPIFSGAHADLVHTTVAGVEVTAIMTAVNVAATYLGFRWIDRFGRKALAIGGYTGMIVFALVSALGLGLLSGTTQLVVIMVGLDFFIASFAIGVGGVGWTLQGEVFPTAVRGQAAAFAAMIDWLANFALIEVFPVWQNAISLGGVMVCFAALCALAIVFVWKFLPETKELPVEEIVRVFQQQQEHSPLSRAA